jgi:hypothetical protein
VPIQAPCQRGGNTVVAALSARRQSRVARPARQVFNVGQKYRMLKLSIIILVMLIAVVPFWFVHAQSRRHHAAQRRGRRDPLSPGGDGLDGGGADCGGGGCDGGGDGGGD